MKKFVAKKRGPSAPVLEVKHGEPEVLVVKACSACGRSWSDHKTSEVSVCLAALNNPFR